MKGEIFNLLEEFIIENWGEDTFEQIYEEILPSLSTKDPFVGPGTYPDSDFIDLVTTATKKLRIPLDQAVHAFGKFCFPKLGQKMPEYIEGFSHPKDFLLTVHDVIHVEVKKVYKDAEPPVFSYRDSAPDKLTMIYRSKRKLYDFVEGLLEGTSDHFDVPISVERKVAQDNDGEYCEFDLTFD